MSEVYKLENERSVFESCCAKSVALEMVCLQAVAFTGRGRADPVRTARFMEWAGIGLVRAPQRRSRIQETADRLKS
jgi:hypothetical protein